MQKSTEMVPAACERQRRSGAGTVDAPVRRVALVYLCSCMQEGQARGGGGGGGERLRASSGPCMICRGVTRWGLVAGYVQQEGTRRQWALRMLLGCESQGESRSCSKSCRHCCCSRCEPVNHAASKGQAIISSHLGPRTNTEEDSGALGSPWPRGVEGRSNGVC